MASKTPFFIRLRPDLMAALRAESERQGMTMTQIIESALDRQIGPDNAIAAAAAGSLPEGNDGV